MKLYSWNMLYRNPDLDRAFSFISSIDFDVFCLQEVPEQFLERLKTLSAHIAYGAELDFVDQKTKHTYCVVLSKHTIRTQENVSLPEYVQPPRTKTTVRLLYPLGWRLATNRRSIFADIEMPGLGLVRVFCIHLTLSHPRQRIREFEAVMQRRSNTLMIACGDFNILESPHITILNWLLGGRFADIFAWNSERKTFQSLFAKLGLRNPLQRKRTQTISYSQLDHILIPDSFRVTRAAVLPNRKGSDHHPIFVECE